MDSKERLVPSCDTLSTTAPEAQCYLQMSAPTLKQETVDCIDEEEPACSDNMHQSQSLEPSEFVNYYDSKEYALEELKKEFPEDECLQSHVSMNSKIVFENMELSKLTDERQIKHENSGDGLSLLINEENDNKKYQVTVKMERLEEQDILDNAEATSIHYDVLVTPRVIQCKLCGRIFKNSFNLLKHNNEHIKIEINTSGDNEMIELHQCQYYDKVFKNSDNMLAHVRDVHSKKKPKDKLCGKQLPSTLHPDGNINDTNNDKLTGKEDEEMKYICDSCERIFERRANLTQHIKIMHYDYGRTFACWCGKKFRTPTHLRMHMSRQHDGNINLKNNDKLTGKEVEKMKYKCDSCEGTYKSKDSLTAHIKRMHYDYGRMFACWCGKQFRSPIDLRKHMNRQHDDNINRTNNDKLTGKEVEKMKYKCDSCEGSFKSKYSFTKHIKRMHYDYGRTFECWCGEQFRSPMHLTEHKKKRHVAENEVYKCKYCEVVFNVKKKLTQHIKRMHYDYGRMFACWCGKQFRTPMNLRVHMRLQHDGNIPGTNNDKLTGKEVEKMKYKCDSCEGSFKSKYSLTKHIKRMHYDYGRTFACWCGKQFRTPMHLREHKKKRHVAENEVYKCKYCEVVFNKKYNLTQHIKRMHYDYGTTFACWCGKQFRSPIDLRKHMNRQHDGNINGTNKDILTGKEVEKKKYKCDSCEGTYKSKDSLTAHIKRKHYDYGRTFVCWCGKQFRTPMHLREHRRLIHGAKNEVYKCKYCEAVFNVKRSLTKHITSKHYDYGRQFDCCCGKQFRTPKYLRDHKKRWHDGNINDTNNDKLTGEEVEKMKYKCDSCEGTYKNKAYLAKHIKWKHNDYEKKFAC